MSTHGRGPNALTRGDLLGGVSTGELAEDRELTIGEREPRWSLPARTSRERPTRRESERDGGKLAQNHALPLRVGLAPEV